MSIYVALVVMGWLNIYAAVYDESHASIFDLSQRYGMQMIWLGVSLFLGLAIVLMDAKYFHMFSYPVYWMCILLLLSTLVLGTEIKGARSWIMLGPVALQPAEFMKFGTALALARYMSNYSFSIRQPRNLAVVGTLIAMPAFIIMVLQNDTGSAVVYGSFLFMLYREGFYTWVYVVVGMVVALFILSFLLNPITLLSLLIVCCALGVGFAARAWKQVVVCLSAIALSSMGLWFGLNAIAGLNVDPYYCLMGCTLVSLPIAAIYAYREKLRPVYAYIGLFCVALAFTSAVDFVFNNVMQVHQQKRVLDLLGIESDLKGWGYNVNQSKIAIGSGGFLGKGYLEGTQTKYNFVPEQSTDFIFCTVGEEWGFVGSVVVLVLFLTLILRLMRMGERQREAFGRVYCYGVASIFLIHVVINVGMTIGLMPVIGIPLPFFSYGGSSMIAFTLLFFVAVKLDSAKRENDNY